MVGLGAALAQRSRTEHHSHRTEVHEHRAPTDESVKLLKELEEKALAKVLASLKLDSNSFSGQVLFEYDGMSDRDIARCVFVVNGKRVVAEIDRDTDNRPEDFLVALRDEIARKFANEVLESAMRDMPNPLGRRTVSSAKPSPL